MGLANCTCNHVLLFHARKGCINMLSFSRNDVIDVLCKTIEHDSENGGRTVDTLVAVLTKMGVASKYPWTPMQVRVIIADLLQSGQIDMRPNGLLFLPEASPDPTFEQYAGAWYVTLETGCVKGPFQSLPEAVTCFQTLSNSCRKALGSGKLNAVPQ